jgi:type I restriction enzyme R subunit
VQRLKTQLDQYTELEAKTRRPGSEAILPKDQLLSFREHLSGNRPAPESPAGQAKLARKQATQAVQQLDFEFVLFAYDYIALIDYDYIMALITRYASRNCSRRASRR